MRTRKLGQSSTVFESHDDPPYTAVEDDPFNITPLLLQPRRRRSSMLDKWILDQQQPDAEVVEPDTPPQPLHVGTRSNPYLAYPELLGSPKFNTSAVSMSSYDLVEDDIPLPPELPQTPAMTPSRRGSTHKLLPTPSSFRSFQNPFRSHSPASSVAVSSSGDPAPRSPTTTRGLFFPRAPRSSTETTHSRHTRSSSLSNVLMDPQPSPTTTKSRWRPSVLGHFGMSPSQSSVAPSDSLHHRSRPSISSNHTFTTTLTADGDSPATPPLSAATESIRARSRSYGPGSSVLKLGDSSANASSFSVWSGSGPSYLDDLNDFYSRSSSPRAALSTMSADGYIGMPPRVPLGPKPGSRLASSNTVAEPPPLKDKGSKPEVAYSSPEHKNRTLPRVSFASIGPRGKRKKKLVISGIAAGDTRKFDAAKRWCESFGEVSQITRMPNDDLHVHFRDADVADTVCRLRAKVYIRGVGSVQLSWYTGNAGENNR